MKTQDKEILTQSITQLELELRQRMTLEDENGLLNKEIERLTNLNHELEKELEDYRYKYTMYNTISDKYQNLLIEYVLQTSVVESQ